MLQLQFQLKLLFIWIVDLVASFSSVRQEIGTPRPVRSYICIFSFPGLYARWDLAHLDVTHTTYFIVNLFEFERGGQIQSRQLA